MQGAVRQQTNGVSLVDAKTCQLPVRVGQNAGSPGGIGQGLSLIHIFNWHNFENTTFDCARLTFMIGVNAVGKTTILAAIRYCLTTNRNFNAPVSSAHLASTAV